ncbi:hypothetical protein LOD99_8790 [Oopsacas minuta]|uniref:Tc1-like transposase DDE domain-containing protein n=1 Tax=Oopsacas minuta TaxID=111878 RepID=A0AAV7JGF8_9METZ|nr:hypothetical protein LOD99_8790 [Oopsacas minuta]
MESTIVRRFWLDLAKIRSIEEQKWIGFTAGHDFKDFQDNFYARRGSRSYGQTDARMVQIESSSVWQKAEWPGNSPNLNPIENLWSILKDKVEEFEQASTVNNLIKNLEKAWSDISGNVLQNMVSSMPRRVALVLERQGYYSGK